MSLHSAVTGALDQYLSGHRFEYRRGLRFSLFPTLVSRNSLIWFVKSSFNQWHFLSRFASTFLPPRQFLTPSISLYVSPVVIPHNSNTCPDWRCHVSWVRTHVLPNSLGKQLLELLTRMWSGRAPWNRGKSVCASRRQANNFVAVCSIFELGGITKHLMTGHTGNSKFCFPSTSIEGLGGTKFTVSLGVSH